MPERARDLDEFERLLDTQLGAAAERRYGSRPPSRARARLLLVVAAAAVALIVPVSLILPPSKRPVGAEPFVIRYHADSVTVSVTDAAIDPVEAERQLEKLNVDAVLEFVPTNPSLVGQLVAVGAVTDEIEYEQRDGRIESFTVPSDYTGWLRISLGRPAQPGERYEAHGPHERCLEFVGKAVSDVDDEAEALADKVEWELYNDEGTPMEKRGDPPSTGVVDELLPVSPEEVTVVVTPSGRVFGAAGHEC